MVRDTYDAYTDNLHALFYNDCDCHDSPDHEVDMRCRCVVCYSNTIDVLHDWRRDAEMERGWDKHPNR